MTSGQMAPTTHVGQVTTTTPFGRKPELTDTRSGYASCFRRWRGAAYIERVAVNNVKNIRKAKAAIRKAFELQIAGKGFTLVEVLSTCPTNWGMNPLKALKWLEENMLPHYPLGVYKDVSAN